MPAPFTKYEKVLKYISDIGRARSIRALESLLVPLLYDFGIQHYICTSYGLPCVPGRKPMFGAWDTGWVSHFLRNGYYNEDAIALNNRGLISRGKEGELRPYYWSELLVEGDLTKKQYSIFAEAWDADLREGLVIPLEISDTEHALISMGGRDFKKDQDSFFSLWNISIQSHRRARTILVQDYEKKLLRPRTPFETIPQLGLITKTERIIISMLADDLRAPEIAKSRGTSVSCVRKHLANAKDKLCVDNTEALVYVATTHNIIS